MRSFWGLNSVSVRSVSEHVEILLDDFTFLFGQIEQIVHDHLFTASGLLARPARLAR